MVNNYFNIFCMVCIKNIIFLFKNLNIWLENISIENITQCTITKLFCEFMHLRRHCNSFQSSTEIYIILSKLCSTIFSQTILHKYAVSNFNETSTVTVWMTICTVFSIVFFSRIEKCFCIWSSYFTYYFSSLSSIFVYSVLKNSLRNKITKDSRSIFTFSRRFRANSCSNPTFFKCFLYKENCILICWYFIISTKYWLIDFWWIQSYFIK